MPLEQQLAHRVIRGANLPYITNQSPEDTTPCYTTGSQNLLTSYSGYAQRRPGFANTVETSPTTFNNLQRQYIWEPSNGQFIEMANNITATSSIVYKRQIGTDANYVSLFTDSASTGAFDFTSSNGVLYFSNGNVAKKWSPTLGVENWGISSATSAIAGPTTCTSGVDDAYYVQAWTNASNVTSAVNYATIGISAPHSGIFADSIISTGYGFAISGSVAGIVATVDAFATAAAGTLYAYPVLNGSPIRSVVRSTQITSASVATYTLGSSSDTWGQTWTSSQVNASNFGVAVSVINNSGQNNNFSIRNVRVTIYFVGGPVVTLTGTGLTATTGYQYVVCYGNSNTGHVSSPSPGSNVVKPANQSMQVALVASSDPQVNQIRVFRSTDSVTTGQTAGTFFEIPTSPFTNTNQNIVDAAPDTSLNVSSIAPTPTFNDPPLAGTSATYFAGRIWMIVGNSVVFSSLEENTIGVPEESFPSGKAGNFWTFNEPPQALGVAGTGSNQQLVILCGGSVYGIAGNSLDTFRRFVISLRRGCRNVKAVSSLGGVLAWRDSSGQVWATDGNSLNEIGIDIRPDLANYTPGNDCVTFHVAGNYHWLIVSTGTALYVYDMDMEKWMPPWTFSCNHLFSGQTSPGVYSLLASTTTLALQLNTSGSNNDNGSTYQPIARTALMALVPDFGNRLSYMAVGIYDEPSRTGTPYYFQVDTNNIQLSDVGYLNDDDPQLAAITDYKSVWENQTTPEQAFVRRQGKNIKQNVFANIEPTSRWLSWQIKGKNADDQLRIYSFFMAYKQTR